VCYTRKNVRIIYCVYIYIYIYTHTHTHTHSVMPENKTLSNRLNGPFNGFKS